MSLGRHCDLRGDVGSGWRFASARDLDRLVDRFLMLLVQEVALALIGRQVLLEGDLRRSVA